MNDKDFLEKSILKIGEFNRFGSIPGLERVSELLERLGNPHRDLNVIHVGGTNGKGSVCRYVYSVLQEAGYRAGLFISPYIEDFTERIEYNGKQIDPEDLYRITENVTCRAAEMVADGFDSPTEFEVLTAIAFCYYRDKKADPVVLEVGLGGIGDSTNVVEKPLVSCITSVSMDHMDFLGDTLGMIAREKAGIIKSGCPLVYFSDNEEVSAVIEGRAKELNAGSFNCSGVKTVIASENMRSTVFSAVIDGESFESIRLSMPGRHQINNAVCALKTVQILRNEHGYSITDEALKAGMSAAVQPGRIEIISEDPLVVLDGSHNEDSIRALTEWAEGCFEADDRLLVVTGILKDKEYVKIGKMLADMGSDFIVTEPDNPRKLDGEKYKEVLERFTEGKKSITVIKNPEAAAEYGLNKFFVKNEPHKSYKALIFTGSLYMIGVVRRKLRVF
ncbi:MAG: folylpolyglutamate synthase/dihydrofolate synthase family protein [Bacillota bacterium]|nr:folylpolyglutamate synthase/dihydrofolate synthase family protein [Bacillota bacterium]